VARAVLVVELAAIMVILGLFLEAVDHPGKVVMAVVQLKGKTLIPALLVEVVEVVLVVKGVMDTL
jgi:hypothetical protein